MTSTPSKEENRRLKFLGEMSVVCTGEINSVENVNMRVIKTRKHKRIVQNDGLPWLLPFAEKDYVKKGAQGDIDGIIKRFKGYKDISVKRLKFPGMPAVGITLKDGLKYIIYGAS